jgi:uncharacterized protein with ACT and thioredoxin-like domain
MPSMMNYFSPKVAPLVPQDPVNKGFLVVIDAFDKAVINSD